MAVTKEQVLDALGKVAAPDGTPLPKTGTLSDIVAGEKVFFSINVDAALAQAWDPVRKRAEAAVRAIPGVQSAMVALTAEKKGGAPGARPQAAPGRAGAAPRGEQGPQGVPGVTSIIAVASGKGGVGKSTTAVNLALGLRDLGMKVGILDADIYGPSLPKLLAIREKPQTVGGTRLKPIERHGLTVMSIGFLIEEETPMIWRGPMVMSALTQMLREVEWGTLDIMVVDMPPGTGDAQLTMAAGAAQGLGDRLDAAGSCLDRCATRHRDVQARQRAGARHRREHEHVHLPEVRGAVRHLRPRWGAARGRAPRRSIPRRSAAGHGDPGDVRRWPADRGDAARRPSCEGLSRYRSKGSRPVGHRGCRQTGAQDRGRVLTALTRLIFRVGRRDPGETPVSGVSLFGEAECP